MDRTPTVQILNETEISVKERSSLTSYVLFYENLNDDSFHERSLESPTYSEKSAEEIAGR